MPTKPLWLASSASRKSRARARRIPASAAALAGIRRALALDFLDAEEASHRGLVGILTSHGLKNSLALSQVFTPPPQVEGTWEALRSLLN